MKKPTKKEIKDYKQYKKNGGKIPKGFVKKLLDFLNQLIQELKIMKNKNYNINLHSNPNCKDSVRCYPHSETGQVVYQRDRDIIKECSEKIKEYEQIMRYIKRTKLKVPKLSSK